MYIMEFSVTYGEIIDLYDSVCVDSLDEKSADELFITKFLEQYPYRFRRSERFIETIKRIIRPTKPNIRGPSKLTGSSLVTYRSRRWEPKVTNPKGSSSDVEFPIQLYADYGINEELLEKCIDAILIGKNPPWILCAKKTKKLDFYLLMHPYLKRWKKTQHTTQNVIGSFYIAIDNEFSGKRPDNVYKFVDSSLKASDSSCLKDSKTIITDLSNEVHVLQEKLDLSKNQLHLTNKVLKDITNEKQKVEKERDSAIKKAARYQESNRAASDDIEHLVKELENFDQFDVHADDLDVSYLTDTAIASPQQEDFTLTKTGKLYSNKVRKLYYTLLAQGVPTTKIENLVKDIVKWSNPLVDVSKLKLPKHSCASYLRKEEMKVISNAHKATSLCDEIATGKGLKINTDGTTKNQKKISGIAINGMTISVNEVGDGSALTVINDVAHELDKLRKTALALGIPNADSINWSLIEASTSDSAATQKHFNDLLFQNKEAYSVGSSNLTFVENFCSIHLGVNLRKAFLSGLLNDDQSGSHFPADTFVHQFCKVFGQNGTPEYGCGNQNFPDFLNLMCEDKSVSESKRKYYQQCLEVHLQRQVGNRYFVTASNASAIIFLKPAALDFMKYTGRDKSGNKLEKEICQKLDNEQEILHIILDSLLYYHVYADLIMISKSKQLNKSALDLNTHYLELKCFLMETEKFPEIVLDKEYKLFVSEERLYGKDKAVNHRLNRPVVYEAVFNAADKYSIRLKPLIVSGSVSMHKKLCAYAVNQLPGGIYWEPEDPAVRKVLSELSPSNDLCESLLGLNDYLTTSIPNLDQMSRSNLVEVRKNKTVHWLEGLESRDQNKVIDLAVACKKQVQAETKLEKKIRDEERRKRMKEDHQRRKALEKRNVEEKRKLSELHLITTITELDDMLNEVDNTEDSQNKRDIKKLNIIKTQINIRKKVLGQKIKIPYTVSGRKRPTIDIITEFKNDMASFPSLPDLVYNPLLLIGHEITHKFQVSENGESKWYKGIILSYDSNLRMHQIHYDEEEEPCSFDIILDYLNGDLIISDEIK